MNDEQVGNNSYVTMTPGSAVAGQLQQILTSKRLEARQAMIDEMNRRNTESEIAYRDENAKSLAENRAAQAQLRTSQANKEFLGELGDNPTNLDPVTAAKLAKIAPNRLQTTPAGSTLPSKVAPAAGLMVGAGAPSTPLPSEMTDSPAVDRPATNTYTGSPAYQKSKAITDQLTSLAGDPAFASLDDTHKLLKISAMFPGSDPAPMLERLMTAKSSQAGGHQYVVDPANPTKRIDLGVAGPNDKFEMLPRELRQPAEPPVMQYWGTDDNTGKRVLVNTYRNGKSQIVPAPEGITLDDKVGARGNTAKPPKVAGPTWNLYSAALQAASQGKTQAEPQLKSQAEKIGHELGMPQHVIDTVMTEFKTPENRVRTPKFSAGEGSTPAEAAQANELWNYLTAGFKQAIPQ